MAKYAHLTATGLPHGVLLTIQDSAGKQVPFLYPEPDANAPDNRARFADGTGAISPATYVPNGTYIVAYSGGSQTIVVSGASGAPADSMFVDLATQAELNAAEAADSGTYVSVADRTRRDSGVGITRCITAPGSLIATFGNGLWTGTTTGTLTQAYNGFDASGNRTGIPSKTGMPEMLSWALVDNAFATIALGTPTTNLRTKALNGQFVLAVYVANLPGYQAGGTPAGSIFVVLTTDAGQSYTNGLQVAFNQNQLREGWNFLKFKMRDATAYVTGGSTTEYHPIGVSPTKLGDGSASNIVANPITAIKISTQNLSGATLYFDSIRTGGTTIADIVLGIDLQVADTQTYSIPLVEQYGWKGYLAPPARIWAGGDTILTALPALAVAQYAHARGWDIINHTINHYPGTQATPTMATLTTAASIDYEVTHARSMYTANGMVRGAEFYASPQGKSSRLSENTIKNAGFVLQRHTQARSFNTILGWGLDNPQFVGGIDIGNAVGPTLVAVTAGAVTTVVGCQQFSKIKRYIDVAEAYGDAFLPFWHNVTTLGDSGSGEDLTGDNLVITYSALSKAIDYIKARDDAGGVRVRDGLTGWYYGVGR